MTSFGERVRGAIASRSRLCVGIDPHPGLLATWGLRETAAGVREFGLRVVDASIGRVGVVKPQVAFFERYGSQGYAALEDVMAAARDAELIVIADAKRGDIGSTMDAYARTWLTPGAPLEADALTVSPYLGVGALHASMELAKAHDKGLFVLAATSNPEAKRLQGALIDDDDTVAATVLDEVSAFNAMTTLPGEWGSIGLVIGATVNLVAAGLGYGMSPVAPILAPGFGYQGASLDDIDDLFSDFAPAVLANESRGVLGGGPGELISRIDERVAHLRGAA